MKIAFFLSLLLCIGTQAHSQDTTQLTEKTFYEISNDASGKAIVYAQRRVQLKKKGTFKAVTEKGTALFTLNKTFHLDGNFVAQGPKDRQIQVKYIDGVKVYSEESFDVQRIVKATEVTQKDGDYFITRYKTFRDDSTVERYQNRKPVSKAKYRKGQVVFFNDKVADTAVFYDYSGQLTERHANRTEEKYRSNGEVYYKRVFLKGRTEEYTNGSLSKTYEFGVDSNKRDVVVETTYDEAGNLKTRKEGPSIAEVAPEYMIWELGQKEFESLKSIAKKL